MKIFHCAGQYYESWPEEDSPYQIPNYFAAGCLVLSLFLTGVTSIIGRNKTTLPKNATNLGHKLIHSAYVLMTGLLIAVLIKYSR